MIRVFERRADDEDIEALAKSVGVLRTSPRETAGR